MDESKKGQWMDGDKANEIYLAAEKASREREAAWAAHHKRQRGGVPELFNQILEVKRELASQRKMLEQILEAVKE